MVTIDAEARLLQLNVPENVLAERHAAWRPHPSRYTRGVLAKYARLVSSSSLGAVTDGIERSAYVSSAMMGEINE